MIPELQSQEESERRQNVYFKAWIYCSEYWMHIKLPYPNAYDKYYSFSSL